MNHIARLSIVVPANAVTHNHRTKCWPLCQPQPKTIGIVLDSYLQGVGVLVFAGTTG
jgi:hypothetical protein